MKSIRILLCDDQPLFRKGLRILLSLQPDFEVVDEAGDGAEAIELAKKHRPAVVLMDLQMPGLDGIAATRSVRAELPDCQVIALTTFDDDENVFEALRAGAIGYLLKDVPPEKLFEAIRLSARGESFIQPSVARKVVVEFARLSEKPPPARKLELELLSEREREVLRLVTNGASNKEIAGKLFIAPGTVKNHITNILSKLGVRDRTQAALKGRDLDLV
jgi:DNA-binding NarL/FixJ family response regulator